MDKETVSTIIKLNEAQTRQFEILLKEREVNHGLRIKGVQKSIEAGLEAVALELQKRNGTINKIQEELCEVKDHTSWWRFFQRNPKVTATIFILTFAGVLVLFGIKVPEDGIGVSLFQHLLEKIF